MSLNLVIENVDGQELPVGAIIDETPRAIKKKLFGGIEAGTVLDLYPNMTALTFNGKVLKNNVPVLFQIGEFQNITLKVVHVLQNIEQLDIHQLYIDMAQTRRLDGLLDELQATFADLQLNDLEFAVKVFVLQSSPLVFGHLQDDINMFITNVQDQYMRVPVTDAMDEFYDVATDTDRISSYIDYDSDGIPVLSFSNVSVIFRGKSYLSGVQGKFVKLNQIFNTFQTSKDIPFVAIERNDPNGDTNGPLVKVYNHLLDEVSEKEFKSWILNEKQKRNLTTYKKVRGLMLKYQYSKTKYITINLFENGTMSAKLELDDSDTKSYADLIQLIKNGIDKVCDTVNEIPGAFYRSRQLEKSKDSSILVDSLSCSATTKQLLDRRDFADILSKAFVSENLFEQKDTLSEETLSMFYKKSGVDGTNNSVRGISVTIKDNPYEKDSSVVNILGMHHFRQAQVILQQLFVLSEMYASKSKRNLQVKERSHIKALRKKGVEILSTKCQKPRQPALQGDAQPMKDSYTVTFNNISYVCPSKNYPYPGFTNENIVCCFKKDQRRRPAYVRNIKSDDTDILVQPSNFKVRVHDNATRKKFETFVIKVVSEYMEGFDETNSMSRFYFLSNGILVPITNQALIDNIEEQELQNIWLDRVPLAKILSAPPKNKCHHLPDMKNTDKSDINNPCAKHPKNKFFGYNSNSYPCCFDKERDPYANRRRKPSDITKQHILISDKILDTQRLGHLPGPLNKVVNETLNKGSGTFYRMGVVQNKSSFLNALIVSSNGRDDPTTKEFLSAYELKKEIVRYLHANETSFEKLNGGNIALKYITLSNYISTITSTVSEIHWQDICDVLERILGINVLVLDIPYTVSDATITPDHSNIRIVCNAQREHDTTKPYVVLLKRRNKFEVVVYNTDDTLAYTFPSENDVVQFFIQYHSTSCVKEDSYPETFPFVQLYEGPEVQRYLAGTPHEIKGEVVNNNKVYTLVTKKGLLIPIKERGMTELKKYNISQLPQLALDVDTTADYIVQVNDVLQQQGARTGIGVSGSLVNDDGLVNALATNFGVSLPTRPSPQNGKHTFPILPYKYYPEAEGISQSNTDTPNRAQMYHTKRMVTKNDIFDTKKRLGNVISKSTELTTQVGNLVSSKTIPRSQKMQQLIQVFKGILGPNQNQLLLDHIAHDTINDNIENLLLHNTIRREDIQPNEVTRKEFESVLVNLNDLQTWIRRYKPQDVLF